MYYTGTKEQCEQYDSQVTEGEGYAQQTKRWANPKKHPTQELWVIIKHPDYECDMDEVDSLGEDWDNSEENINV